MSYEWDDRLSRLEGLMDSVAGQVKNHRPGWWSLTDGNGSLRQVDVRMVDEWLRLETAADDEAENHAPWELLCRNGSLDPAAKLLLPANGGGTVLCADVPVRAGLEDGVLAALVARLGVETSEEKERASGACIPASDELVDLCREAGWDAAAKSDGAIRIDCSIRGSLRALGLQADPETGALTVATGLADLESPTEAVREAVAVLLLSLSDAVWGLRAFADERGERVVAGIETMVWGNSADAVGDAVAAVAFGCDLAADEATALGDNAVAEKYLELRGTAARLQETGARRAS
jgi:hypothetical protein